MSLSFIDWAIVGSFFALSLFIGIYTLKYSSKSASNFFLSGRNMPWWVLGVSMVATTFAADTPGLVAGIVRQDGISGNWVWWSFLLTGMLTVFFYAKLWRRTGITTDLEFYELRYSGKSASFLRGFRALYLGVFFNIVIMATVCLAAIKIGHVLFGFSATKSLIIACSITAFYSMLGGLKGVLITDFVQFIIAMTGSIWASIYVVNRPEIGGIQNLIQQVDIQDKLSMFPDFNQPEVYVPLFVIPLAVQWWSVWYPGAEPGGGGYIVQRMLAAKNEKHATLATLFFNVMHYAIRPWPWIIMGLASIVIYPNLVDLQHAYPNLSPEFIKNDLSYAAMLQLLPAGLIGIVVTSLIAAFMSTISTHLNWGSSYIVNDFYVRFIKPEASSKQQVLIGRLSILIMMLLSALLAFVLEEAKDAFDLLLQIGAGTGLLFIVRWFWYRINPYSEITAMLVSFVIALVFFINKKNDYFWFEIQQYEELIYGVVITSLAWICVSLLTNPSNKETLKSFDQKAFNNTSKFHNFRYQISSFLAATIGVYALLFGIGQAIFGNFTSTLFSALICVICSIVVYKFWKKI
ncbi:sodium:solute symporter family protein [Psychroflexus sp. MBR-150]|jgi:SSS family transporter